MSTATASVTSVRAPRGYVAFKNVTITLLSSDLQFDPITGQWKPLDGQLVGRRVDGKDLTTFRFARKVEDLNPEPKQEAGKPVLYRHPEVRVQTVREATSEADPILNRPELIAKFYREVISKAAWFNPEVECFVAIHLNRKNRILSYTLVSLGTATSSLAHPREVFRAAIVASATAVICLHNHPSGDPAPSAADVQVTRQLRDASKAVDIELLDHVVIGEPKHDPMGRGYYSFREAGVI